MFQLKLRNHQWYLKIFDCHLLFLCSVGVGD